VESHIGPTVAEVLDGECLVVNAPHYQIEIRGAAEGAIVRVLPAHHHKIP
jgi:hypothetical protein